MGKCLFSFAVEVRLSERQVLTLIDLCDMNRECVVREGRARGRRGCLLVHVNTGHIHVNTGKETVVTLLE